MLLFSNSLRTNENNLIYFRKQLGNEGKQKFFASGAVFRVTCCVEIKLQYFFHKFIFICTIYTLLMQLISVILYDTVKFMVAATLGKNLRPPVRKWSNDQWLLPIGKPRAVDNMASMFWGWYFKSSVCVCWPAIGNYVTKLYTVQQYVKC